MASFSLVAVAVGGVGLRRQPDTQAVLCCLGWLYSAVLFGCVGGVWGKDALAQLWWLWPWAASMYRTIIDTRLSSPRADGLPVTPVSFVCGRCGAVETAQRSDGGLAEQKAAGGPFG
jgi:hypothetical protein